MNRPDWHFAGHAVTRVQIALRLQRDLGINTAGVALVLDLLEELQTLRRSARVLTTSDMLES